MRRHTRDGACGKVRTASVTTLEGIVAYLSSMLTRRSLATCLAATPVLGAVGACGGDPSSKLIGKTMPDSQLLLSGGATINLAKLGAPALIRFWGLWCPVCKRDEEHWLNVVRAMRGRGDLQVMTVHSGPVPANGPDLDSWEASQADDVRIPVVDDSQRVFSEQIGLPGVPLVLLVNRKAEIFDTAWAFKSARGVRSFLARATYTFDRAS